MPLPDDPVKLLDQVLKKKKKSIAEFARETKLAPNFLSRILSGKRRVGAIAASAIDHGTDGEVPARLWGDWYRAIDERDARRRNTG